MLIKSVLKVLNIARVMEKAVTLGSVTELFN